jgi:hypothetical protein
MQALQNLRGVHLWESDSFEIIKMQTKYFVIGVFLTLIASSKGHFGKFRSTADVFLVFGNVKGNLYLGDLNLDTFKFTQQDLIQSNPFRLPQIKFATYSPAEKAVIYQAFSNPTSLFVHHIGAHSGSFFST